MRMRDLDLPGCNASRESEWISDVLQMTLAQAVELFQKRKGDRAQAAATS